MVEEFVNNVSGFAELPQESVFLHENFPFRRNVITHKESEISENGVTCDKLFCCAPIPLKYLK